MKNVAYLDRLLLRYAGTFDIYKPYMIDNKEYPAYGYFFSSVEKYVLIREANMWTSNSHEHVLFMTVDELTASDLAEAERVIRDYFEPVLVRNGQKYPDKNHMYSYLTVIILADSCSDKKLIRKIKSFKFEKGYLFNFRGFSQGRIAAVFMDEEKVATNYQGRKLYKLLKKVFDDVHKGKKTFTQLCEEDESVRPYKQEELKSYKG